MEKIIYALSRDESRSWDERALLDELAQRLREAGVRRLTIAVHDADVAAADKLRIVNREPAIDATVCVWVDSANDRQAWEAVLLGCARSMAGYLVTESEPLRASSPSENGARTPGMMQIAFLRIPPGMDENEWFTIWRDDHTGIAIETQSTFIYRQNLVVRALTDDAPECAAIVEEAFPGSAMSSQHAFYDAIDDDDKLERNRRRMWQSSKRFVDVETIEVVPTSEYTWGDPNDD
jgi:hypothetical protein